MGLVIGNILRTIIIALATAVPLTVLQEILDGTLVRIIEAITKEHGLSKEEAGDIVVNILVDLALNATVIGVVVKTKFAVITAERLGLTSKGFAKRTLTPKAATAFAKMQGPWEKFKAYGLASKAISLAGAGAGLIWLGSAIANAIEPGIYQPRQTNNVYEAIIGVRPFPEPGSQFAPGPYKAESFNALASSLEAAGVKGINNPVTKATMVYSREALADLIEYVYGKQILAGVKIADYRAITPLLQQYMSGANKPSTGTTPVSSPVASAPVAQSTKVFTGVISQGVLGGGLSFVPREDDLIEDMGELQTAINNNVAPYLAALPAKITYEIKVVASVVVGGIRRYGESKQIQSGKNSDGTARFKTVVNKFAVVDLYFIKEGGTRYKLTTIVLGPTNALRFQPSGTQLQGLEGDITSGLLTSNTKDIDIVVSGTPTTAITAGKSEPSNDDELAAEVARLTKIRDDLLEAQKAAAPENEADIGAGYYTFTAGNSGGSGTFPSYAAAYEFASKFGTVKTINEKEINSPPSKPKQTPSAPVKTPTPPKAENAPVTKAKTLAEYYVGKGETLPPISTRARLYESLGLGQAAYYTGTAEQNTKLLNKLQG